MIIHRHADKDALGRHAAEEATRSIQAAIKESGKATIVIATGASQFEILKHLVATPDIRWSAVTVFHMDEYVDLPESHPASFRLYLKERFLKLLPEPPQAFHFIDGNAPDPEAECARLGKLLQACRIDLLLGGIGENAHLAFNDPPADFELEDAYHVVQLDRECRAQQVNEGWFASLDEVPERAISISIQATLRAERILVSCPDARKAAAVKATAEGPVTPDVPASILQKHKNVELFLDSESAAKLQS